MVKIGWLKDSPGFIGGADISWSILKRNTPANVELVYCPPNKRPPQDIDGFVIQNNIQYNHRWIEELAKKPVIKQIRDPWAVGDSILRRWLLERSSLLIFNSQPHIDYFGYNFSAPHVIIPPPVDIESYKEAALPSNEREGNIFVGRVGVTKGAHLAIDWALEKDEPLDLYGMMFDAHRGFGNLPATIKFHGFVPNERMPYIMGKAKRFLFFPTWVEAFGRVVVEAFYAGCKIMTNDESRIGAFWWLNEHPELIGKGIELFWDKIMEVFCE